MPGLGLRIGGVAGEETSTRVFDEDILSCIDSDRGDAPDGDGEGLLERRGSVKTGIVFAILARRFMVRESRHDQLNSLYCITCT
jgi:hypothetical protein